MAKRKSTKIKSTNTKTLAKESLKFRDPDDAAAAIKDDIHIYAGGAVCETDTKGYAEPENRSPTELVVHASEGFIPLWDTDVTLRWRFDEHSMSIFQDIPAAKNYLRVLLGDAILAWEDASPVKFSERHDAWDFELLVRSQDNCNTNGCTLASAFFPDAGRHQLVVYPQMFAQSPEEQVETMAHELGHIFGLRHFFANVTETAWPSEVFGKHDKFSIMNYGPNSRLTKDDISDLKSLYQMVWSGELTEINGTPIRLMRPFSHSRTISAQSELLAAFYG